MRSSTGRIFEKIENANGSTLQKIVKGPVVDCSPLPASNLTVNKGNTMSITLQELESHCAIELIGIWDGIFLHPVNLV